MYIKNIPNNMCNNTLQNNTYLSKFTIKTSLIHNIYIYIYTIYTICNNDI